MGASESIQRVHTPSSTRLEAYSPSSDDAASITGIEDDSTTVASSLDTAPSSNKTLFGSLGEHGPMGILDNKALDVRPETRDFYENLYTFFELKKRIETTAETVMPENAVKQYEDIMPPFCILTQECVPEAGLQAQLDVLYAHAEEAEPKFDDFCRKVVRKVDLEPDAIMLEQEKQTWYTYTATALKARDRAIEKAQNECESDASRLVDIVRASIVVDTEAAFEVVVKCFNENYVGNEREGVRVVRFKNRYKKPLADGQRDVLYNISITLSDCSSRFVCELQVHMKQILDYKEATHGPYGYFRSYFKGGSGKAVSERMVLLEKFARRDVDDISQIVTSALKGDDEVELGALDELFHKLSELEIVVLIRRRQLELASSNVSSASVEMGNDWLTLARRLGSLAIALDLQAKYDEAKPLYERSLSIREVNLGERHPDVATSLNNLANSLKEQGKYDEATPLIERSLRIRENTLGENHPDVATSLNSLANLLSMQGKYDEAKPLIERSLRIRETQLGEHHSDVASSLHNLAILLSMQGNYEEAKPHYDRSLRIRETTFGKDHPKVATSLTGLASLLNIQRKYDEAKPLIERSLRIQETNLGGHHPDVASSLNNLANLLSDQGKYDEAKPLYERSLRIREKNLDEHHPDVATSLNNLAFLLYDKGEYDEAKPLMERSLRIRETNLGEQHPNVADSLNTLAALLYQQGTYDEAKPLYERSLRIRESYLGAHHPLVADSLENLANLLKNQGTYDEAKPLYERSLQIRESYLGAHHPIVADSLENLATLLRNQGKYEEAKPLYERSLRIRETYVGNDQLDQNSRNLPRHPSSLSR